MEVFDQLNHDLKVAMKEYGEENILKIFYCNDITEVIVIPSFENVCINTPLIDEKIIFNNGKDFRVMKVKDIRFAYHAKANNCAEMVDSLFTDDYIVNPRYEHIYENLFRRYRYKYAAANAGDSLEELQVAITKLLRMAFNENSRVVKFIKQLTDLEKTAINVIIDTVGEEGTFSQAKIASAAGISRAAMTNLIRKINNSGVAEIQFKGVKGTYFKLIDDTLLDITGQS